MAAVGPVSNEVKKAAKDFVSFLNKAVTPYHAVEESAQRLKAAGFQELKEAEPWKIEPARKYYVIKNRSAILAFAIGAKFQPGNGYSVVVGHTDSPALKVKPISKACGDKFLQVGVSTYGGGIWHTWFDRDLSIAGQVIYKTDDCLTHKLIDVKSPVMYIPNLAIHFTSGSERNRFEYNNETNLKPVIASYAAEGLSKREIKRETGGTDTGGDCAVMDTYCNAGEHHEVFLKLVAEKAGCREESIVDWDLYLYDSQKAKIGGIHEEFISGQRLDNLVGVYTCLTGLLDSLNSVDALANEENVRIAACYDNEECGSESAQGAASGFTEHVLRRLASGGRQSAFEEAIGKSFLISADQAHAAHPNYRDKHEECHRPEFHGGVVVKVNANQRYATTSTTHAILKQIAAIAQVPLQKVVVRNDMPCGSTVGPILSARLGLQTVDVGCPQLAMHSIREFACTSSIHHATQLYSAFYQNLPRVLASTI